MTQQLLYHLTLWKCTSLPTASLAPSLVLFPPAGGGRRWSSSREDILSQSEGKKKQTTPNHIKQYPEFEILHYPRESSNWFCCHSPAVFLQTSGAVVVRDFASLMTLGFNTVSHFSRSLEDVSSLNISKKSWFTQNKVEHSTSWPTQNNVLNQTNSL